MRLFHERFCFTWRTSVLFERPDDVDVVGAVAYLSFCYVEQ